jgi:hypothetical protein
MILFCLLICTDTLSITKAVSIHSKHNGGFPFLCLTASFMSVVSISHCLLCYAQDFQGNQSTAILKNSTELLSYVSRLWFLLILLLPLLEACKRYCVDDPCPSMKCISYTSIDVTLMFINNIYASGPCLPISIRLCSFPCELQLQFVCESCVQQ